MALVIKLIHNLGLAYVITHGQDEEEEAAADE